VNRARRDNSPLGPARREAGAPPGDYIVTFTKPRIAPDWEHNGVEMEVDDFQSKYSDPKTSNWTVTVKKGDNDLGTFRLD
jgi:hypothetical protein